jgi:hypothetical protein
MGFLPAVDPHNTGQTRHRSQDEDRPRSPPPAVNRESPALWLAAFKDQRVAAFQQIDSEWIRGAIRLVILRKLRPQSPRLGAHFCIDPRIIGRVLIEHVNADSFGAIVK